MVPSAASPLRHIAPLFGRAGGFKVAALLVILFLLDLPVTITAQSDRTTGSSARDRSSNTAWRQSAVESSVPQESPRVRTTNSLRTSNDSPADVSGFSIPAYADAGQVWREYNLAPYTNRLAALPHPEQTVVDWIFKQTGPENWYGEEIAVLSATRGRLRVFHRPEIQDQVEQIVDRFTRPAQGQVSIRVQFATTTDLNWRSNLAHLLKPMAYGPDGQQIWLIAPEDASLIRNRIQPDRSAAGSSQLITAKNGQEAGVESGRPVTYISGLELTGGTYLSYQPVVGRLQEGIRLTFMPLWTSDGTAVDAVVKITTRVVQKLHYAQGAAPLSSGNQETVMQVPETVATHFEQTVHWPISQVMLISAGMQPPNLTARRGSFSFGPSAVELLILAEIAPPFSPRAANAREALRE